MAGTGGGECPAMRRWWPVRAKVVLFTIDVYEQAEDDEIPMLLSGFALLTVNNMCTTQDLRHK